MMLREPELEFEDEWEIEPESEWEIEAEDEWEDEATAGLLDREDELELPQYEVLHKPDARQLDTNTRAAPFRYICNLVYNGRPICTGTLIGPRTVLTAGHCLVRKDPRHMQVLAGRNGPTFNLGAAHAVKFHVASGYSPLTPTDYGVIQLREPIGIRVGYWTIRYSRSPTDPIGRSISARGLPENVGTLKVNLSGYPGEKCLRIPGPPARKDCRIKGTQQWRAYDVTVRQRAGMLHYMDDTTGGMSGSPVWVRRSPDMGGRVMVAVHVGWSGVGTKKTNVSVRLTPTIMGNLHRWLAEVGTVTPGGPVRPAIPGARPRVPTGIF
jgi:glutamyl endopeptidase